MSESPNAEETIEDPWDQFAWLVASIWLVFLAFPFYAAWTIPNPLGLKLLASLLIVTFGAFYFSVWRFQEKFPRAWLNLALLIGLAATLYPLIGLNILSLAAFVVAYSMFAFPPPTFWVVSALVIFGSLALIPLLGVPSEWWFMAIPVTSTALLTGVIRFIELHQSSYKAMQESYLKMAERELIARDVHDLLSHSLTAITLKAEVAERLIAKDPDRSAAEMREIQGLARRAITEVRDTVSVLRARSVASELAGVSEVLNDAGISMTIEGEPSKVTPRFEGTLAWALRESVTNVVRHSAAKNCRIRVTPSSVVIEDDGVGMPADSNSPLGNGLRGLEERVVAEGGSLSVTTTPGSGTKVEVVL